MLPLAVTRTWQNSLRKPLSIGRVYDPTSVGSFASTPSAEWRNLKPKIKVRYPANDDVEDDPEVRIDKRDDIVPKRPLSMQRSVAIKEEPSASDGFWKSHEFWMGIVFGAAVVLVIKTVLAVRAPLGVDWYQF